jgi:uncharacterized Fe-S cluster-containing MiaB family protein
VGFILVYKVTDQIIIDREIASINQTKISNLNFFNEKNIQNELYKKIKIYTLTAEKEKIVALDGFSSQLCKTFPKIDIYFEAYGVTVSGEATEFKVSADCVPAQDPAEIATIKIPYEKLLSERPRNAEFKFSGYTESFEFINTENEWNKTWLLSKIVFKSETESKVVKINSSNHDGPNNQPIVLEF